MRRSFALLLLSMVMALVTNFAVKLMYHFVDPRDRFLAVIILIVAIILGVIIYGFLVLKTGLANYVFGKKALQKIKKMIFRSGN
ncbi:hypothetical protein [Xylocopilactobacillus apicola]|nr:hypothetical protein [Xylocopilactobacillus apicola]BDR58547.1 hypothetical protein XA3_09880 [Xylocopilactobacillus apicola]